MNQDFSNKCIDIIKKHIPEGCVVQSKREFVRRRDGSEYTDIDFYYYKDSVSPDIVYRDFFVFEFARLSKNWVELRPNKRIIGTPSPILAVYEDGELRFTSNNNKEMPFDKETSYTECKFYTKNKETNKFEFSKDYVNDDVRKIVASSLKVLTDAIKEIDCPNITLTVYPIVVTEQKMDVKIPVFNYTLGNDVKELPFLDGISLKNLEPVIVQIFNVSELDIILPIMNYSIQLTEMLHLFGEDVMRMMFDPLVNEMKQDDENYRDH
ncbi:Uncharacterised protein [uncultured archaeon]|nr:Uncharacterised protein [uncultured archaeon]